MPNIDYFKLLQEQLDSIELLSKHKNAKGFLGLEILRFNSIAGTLLAIKLSNDNFDLGKKASLSERYITHPLIRSLLENYFKIMYIFDDSNLVDERFEKAVNGFKNDYLKLYNDLQQEDWKDFMNEYRESLPEPKNDWKKLPELNNINDMLLSLKNDNKHKLQYLYPLYRTASFDVHGNSLNVFFDVSFNKLCSFPIIGVEYAINLIASTYVELLNKYK